MKYQIFDAKNDVYPIGYGCLIKNGPHGFFTFFLSEENIQYFSVKPNDSNIENLL